MNAVRSLLLVALLSGCNTVELDSSCDSFGGGEPRMPLDGTWRGKWVVNESFQPNWTLELEEEWREEVERVEVRGTFKSDWAYHIGNYRRPDTIRGDFHGDYCWPDISFSYAFQAPNADGAINYRCDFDGVTNDFDYFAGLTVCDYEEVPRSYVAATYFERVCGPYDCDD